MQILSSNLSLAKNVDLASSTCMMAKLVTEFNLDIEKSHVNLSPAD